MHESADGWADGKSFAVHGEARFVEHRVKVYVAPTRVIGRHIQLVAQTQIERPSARKPPIILDKETVISRALAAVADARAEDRLKNVTVQEVSEVIEIDLASAVQVLRAVERVVNDFGAHADAVLASGERDNISQRSRRRSELLVDNRGRRAESNPAATRRDANQRQARKGVGVGSADSDVRVFHRLVWGVVHANEVVADARFVNGGRAEGVNVLDGN